VNGGAPVLLKNVAAAENHWLGIRLVGKKANPDAIGAKISWQAGGLKRSRLKVGGGSYLSSHDPREVLALASAQKSTNLKIRWPQPSGRVDTFTDLPLDRYITIVEGVESNNHSFSAAANIPLWLYYAPDIRVPRANDPSRRRSRR